MSKKYPEIIFEGCQFKSIGKIKILAKLLDTMEKEFGIKETKITLRNCFVCPDIDLNKLQESNKPMEIILAKILKKIDIKKYGKKSVYKK